MSPRKRRSLALPFLVTVASSCVVKPANTGNTTNSTANTQDPQGQVSANPPPPSSQTKGTDKLPNRVGGDNPNEAAPTDGKKPVLIVNPPPPRTTLPAAPTEGGRLETRADTTCWWYEAADCPKDKNISCNPPPPRQVSCPAK